jgi:hypothetical protein
MRYSRIHGRTDHLGNFIDTAQGANAPRNKVLVEFEMNLTLFFQSSALRIVQTGSKAHPASYTVGTGGVKLSTHFDLVPRLIMVELYLHSYMPSWSLA